MIHKWTNAEGRCLYKGDRKDRCYIKIKKFIGLISLIYIYKTKTKNVFVIIEQKDGHPLFYEIMSLHTFQQHYILIMHMPEEPEVMISYNLLQLCLKSGVSIYDMNISLFLHESWRADSCTHRLLPISGMYTSKTRKIHKKILFAMFKSCLLFSLSLYLLL